MKKIVIILVILVALISVATIYETGVFQNSKKVSLNTFEFIMPDGFITTEKTKQTADIFNENKSLKIKVIQLNNISNKEEYFSFVSKDNWTKTYQDSLKYKDIDVSLIYLERNEYNETEKLTQIYFKKDSESYVISTSNLDKKNNEFFIKVSEEIINTIKKSK
ncbi:MAG: hypothetical protein KO202_02530 [Methanobacteriaceae archaeon]|jgi:hypothetical protein|nr:hypothetical protein [Methanobacteriaceae archaeon]